MKSNKFRSKSFDKYQCHESHSWLKTIFCLLKSTKRHRRNKSEKSTHSYFNDSAIQCSSHFLKMDATRNSLLETYLYDISENSLSKSDLLEIEKYRKLCYKPIKILNQIIQDVMSYFPEIEISLVDSVDSLINEFCFQFLKLQFLHIKRSLINEDSILNLNTNKLFSDSINNSMNIDSSLPSTYSYQIKMENKIQNDYSVNNCYKKYKNLNSKQEKVKATEPLKHQYCKRYVVKKCKNTKEIINDNEFGKLTKFIEQSHKLKNDSVIDDFSVNHNFSYDKQHFSTSKEFENITNDITFESYSNQLCTVSISPMYFLSINSKPGEIKIPEKYDTTSKIIISQQKEKPNLDSYVSQFDTGNIFSQNSSNPRKLSMAQGNDSDLYKGFYCNSVDKITRSLIERQKCNSDLEYSSTLDLEIIFDSSGTPDENQMKTDLSTNENFSVSTKENSCLSKENMYDTSIQVSVMTSIDTYPKYKVPYFPKDLTNSNTNVQIMPSMKMNMFCESLCDKFNNKVNKNIYQCDTEMSFSTKQSKFPDQTILMSTTASNNSDTVCEVLSEKFNENCNATKPLRSSKSSVKFLEILSKDILNKTKFKSSSLFNHTIASKLKIKNSNQFH